MNEYIPDQVVFVRSPSNAKFPARVVCKCGYGTYKVYCYASKQEDYANQYQMEPFTQEVCQSLKQEAGKKDKKLLKHLKSAEKDLLKSPGADGNFKKQAVFNMDVKEEEGEGEPESRRESEIEGEFKQGLNQYEAILALKIPQVIADHRASKTTKYYFKDNSIRVAGEKSSKRILMLRLEWALDDLCFHFDKEIQRQIQAEQTQNEVYEIMESEVVDPVDYVSSSLLKKISEVLEVIDKKKKAKLRNYLVAKKTLIHKGFEAYLKNYSMLFKVCQRYKKEMLVTSTSRDESTPF